MVWALKGQLQVEDVSGEEGESAEEENDIDEADLDEGAHAAYEILHHRAHALTLPAT